jgi:hypothetical protein
MTCVHMNMIWQVKKDVLTSSGQEASTSISAAFSLCISFCSRRGFLCGGGRSGIALFDIARSRPEGTGIGADTIAETKCKNQEEGRDEDRKENVH